MRTIQLGGALGMLLFGALGLFLTGVGLRNVARARASTGWPTAPGVVVSADVTVSQSRSSSSSGARQRTQTDYAPEVRVRYAVGGREYTTTTRRFGQLVGSGNPSDAELVVRRFPVGSAVSVSYRPDDPAVATVAPGFHEEALWFPGGGLAFLAGAIFFLPALFPRGLERGGGGPTATVATLFGVVFCVVGLAMIVPGLRAVLRGRASASWPTTSGVIVFGERPYVADEEAEPPSRIGADTLRASPRAAAVVYAYDAGGRRRYGNVRHFGQLAEADDVARYALGRPVTVAYSPADPDLSTLEPGLAGEAWALPGTGAAFFLFGLAALLVVVPAMRSS